MPISRTKPLAAQPALEIQTGATPTGAGDIQITGDDLKYWGATAGAVQTAATLDSNSDVVEPARKASAQALSANQDIRVTATRFSFRVGGANTNVANLDSNNDVSDPARILSAQALAANGDVRIVAAGGQGSFTWRSNGSAFTTRAVEDEFTLTRSFLGEIMVHNSTGSADNPVLVRNAQGDWSWNRTADEAEEISFAIVIPLKSETSGKGAKLTKVRCFYEIAVADATSVDMLVDSTVYAQATAPAVTNNHGGAIVDGDYDADHNTAAKRADKDVTGGEHVLELTLNTAAFYNTADGFVVAELKAVLANTGTIKVRGFQADYVCELTAT